MFGSIRTTHHLLSFVFAMLQAIDWFYPLRCWINGMDIRSIAIAHAVCRMIPVQCPFERDIYLFGRKFGHIPPLCKLNPLYEEIVGLRFRALCFLADECGEDVRGYC
jgi:hypothetical protein